MKQLQNSEHNNKREPIKKGSRTNTAALAVGAVTAFLAGTIGYELVKNQQAPQFAHSSLMLVPQKSQSSTLDSLQSSPEGYNQRLMNEQNRQQAERIKELQQELAELNHSFHEYKLSLFSRSNPVDLAQIQALTKELDHKNALIEKMKAQLSLANTSNQAGWTESQQQLLYALSEEAQLLGDIKDIIHNQMTRETEALVLDRLEELQTFQAISDSTQRHHAEITQNLATLLELENTLKIIEKQKYRTGIMRVGRAYQHQLQTKEEELASLKATLTETIAELSDLDSLVSLYAHAIATSHELHIEQQQALQAKNEAIKNTLGALKSHYNNHLGSLNLSLDDEKANSAAFYSIIEAQHHLLDQASRALNEHEAIVNNALDTYDQNLDRQQQLEEQNRQLALAVASHQDAISYHQFNTDKISSNKQDVEKLKNNLKRSIDHNKALVNRLGEYREMNSQYLQHLSDQEGILSALQADLERQENIAKNMKEQVLVLRTQLLDKDSQLVLLSQEISAHGPREAETANKMRVAISNLKTLKEENRLTKQKLNETLATLKATQDRYNKQQETLALKERELHSTIEAETLLRMQLIEKIALLENNYERLTAENGRNKKTAD